MTTYDVSRGDCDNDGYLDLAYGGRIYRNTGSGSHWPKVSVRGNARTVPVTAVGTQVQVKLGTQVLTRHVDRIPRVMHFVLGKHAGPVELEVRWLHGPSQPASPGRPVLQPQTIHGSGTKNSKTRLHTKTTT